MASLNLKALLAASALLVAGSAMASGNVNTFRAARGGANVWQSGAPQVAQAFFTPQSGRYEFSTTVTGSATDGFWLAVSPGPNPKGHAGELALLYFDASNANDIKLTAYNYNGKNGGDSWRNGNGSGGAADKIISSVTNKSWINSLFVRSNSDGTRTMGFDINANTINRHKPRYPGSSAWTGMSFSNRDSGIWMHTFDIRDIAYGADGFLTKLSTVETGYIDGNHIGAKAVPEPGTMAALAAAGLAFWRRRKKAQA